MIELRQAGASYTGISNETGLDRWEVARVLRNAGMTGGSAVSRAQGVHGPRGAHNSRAATTRVQHEPLATRVRAPPAVETNSHVPQPEPTSRGRGYARVKQRVEIQCDNCGLILVGDEDDEAPASCFECGS